MIQESISQYSDADGPDGGGEKYGKNRHGQNNFTGSYTGGKWNRTNCSLDRGLWNIGDNTK